jgi:hypothetical protein
MSAPATRGAAIAAYCKGCIHDAAAVGTWREQVAACTACDCPLWRFRPVQDGPSCPHWIKSRDPADLPDGWAMLEQTEAVRTMRRWIADNASARAVRADASTRNSAAMVQPTPAADAPPPHASASQSAIGATP